MFVEIIFWVGLGFMDGCSLMSLGWFFVCKYLMIDLIYEWLDMDGCVEGGIV